MWQALLGRPSTDAVASIAKIVVAGFALVASWPAEAQQIATLPAATHSVASRGTVKPISGWVEFCRREPAECAVDLTEPAKINLSPRSWKTLVSVNQTVNASIIPLGDQEHWGVQDHWDVPEDGYGDCEDFQLLKRKLLVRAGFPARALRITVVLDDKGAGHAVLMVRTDRGDFILDNKRNTVLSWHETGYTFVKREGQEGLAWTSLGGVGSPTATANR